MPLTSWEMGNEFQTLILHGFFYGIFKTYLDSKNNGRFLKFNIYVYIYIKEILEEEVNRSTTLDRS